ncbi:hypothetical protein AAFF_G00203550 [Aldrovandia affinis]|uniref:Uncharacterized protein n=1 Tax=Aldrovandia affinis TaxID=143900 RepID=A0AAD7SX30_9TELE|nr:hypothetical protein AAFF_G00203550 [Aldrovandia affinis]
MLGGVSSSGQGNPLPSARVTRRGVGLQRSQCDRLFQVSTDLPCQKLYLVSQTHILTTSGQDLSEHLLSRFTCPRVFIQSLWCVEPSVVARVPLPGSVPTGKGLKLNCIGKHSHVHQASG